MIKIYDTTLRDGAQREGISLSLEDKLKIAKKLDEFGVHYIEGGYPGSNPKDREFFAEAVALGLRASLVAFGSTRRRNVITKDDPGLQSLLAVDCPAVCLVGKSWRRQVTDTIKASREENMAMISESVAYIKSFGREVIFDAEHFFDGYKEDSGYAAATLSAAAEAGADWIVLCDTNGGTLPHEVLEVVTVVKQLVGVPLGIHAHNDADCAVANSLLAVVGGAQLVQGTVNGYGERCGNANLLSVIPDLLLKMNKECLPPEKLVMLTEVSHYVSEIANITPDGHQPYAGQSAFTHKAGLHVAAIGKDSTTYEHIDPATVGNYQRVVVSELAGRSAIVQKALEMGIDITDTPEKAQDILGRVKELEHGGFQFEAADGSLDILLRKSLGSFRPFFELESFRVIMEKRAGGDVATEATIKLKALGKRVIETAEGNGPVNALDSALRAAIGRSYPALQDIELIDYRVRVLNQKKGTGAVVRVLIESTDGEKSWGTVGVSENIIEASWQALVDSVNYGLVHRRAHGEQAIETS